MCVIGAGKKHVAPLAVYPFDFERSEQILGRKFLSYLLEHCRTRGS